MRGFEFVSCEVFMIVLDAFVNVFEFEEGRGLDGSSI